MKKLCLLLVTSLLMSIGTVLGGASPDSVTGNWKGTLEVGKAKLRLVFKINKSAEGALTAKLDSLDQGARDMPVDSVVVKSNKLRLEVKSIQGAYEGTLDKNGTKATGEWEQAGQKWPLTLEKTEKNASDELETIAPADLPASKLAAQKLAGLWNGTLEAGTLSLRLKVHFAQTPAGTAKGTMDSLDQGAKDIPLSGITLKEGKVRFEARGIGGVYEGTLAPDAKTLTGE